MEKLKVTLEHKVLTIIARILFVFFSVLFVGVVGYSVLVSGFTDVNLIFMYGLILNLLIISPTVFYKKGSDCYGNKGRSKE